MLFSPSLKRRRHGVFVQGAGFRAMRCPLALLVLAILAPAAQATLTLKADLPGDELQPGTGVASGTATVGLDCAQALLHSNGTDHVTVRLSAVGDPRITVVSDAEANLPVAPCEAGASTTQATASFTTSVAPSAPAHRALGFNLTADLPAAANAGAVAPRETQSAALSVRAKALLLVTVASPQAVHLTQHNQTIAFHLANQGNVAVRVEGTLAFSTPLASAPPATADLGSSAVSGSGAAGSDITFTVQAPDASKASEFTATATFQVRPMDGGTAGQPIVATLFFRNEIVPPKSSPAPPVAALGLVLLGVAAARRRA
jgi:MYXO-CTERM domain-containing protein